MALTKAAGLEMYPQERPIAPSVQLFDNAVATTYLDSRSLDPQRPKLSQHHGHCLGFELCGIVETDLV
ncbi:hypothetical protein GB937_007576 [Aspergillus fischeri]|nr:hypothetical protein GB937_007576 [Aspergillus fischeri]